MEEDLTFYVVSAQALPTLLIGFVLWIRNLRLNPGLFLAYLAGQMILTLLAIGACVWVIKRGESTELADGVVQAAYVFLLSGFAGGLWRYFTHNDDVHSGRAYVEGRAWKGPDGVVVQSAPPEEETSQVTPRLVRGRLLAAALVLALVLTRRH